MSACLALSLAFQRFSNASGKSSNGYVWWAVDHRYWLPACVSLASNVNVHDVVRVVLHHLLFTRRLRDGNRDLLDVTVTELLHSVSRTVLDTRMTFMFRQTWQCPTITWRYSGEPVEHVITAAMPKQSICCLVMLQ